MLNILYFASESRFSTEDIHLISESDWTWLILFIVLLPPQSTQERKSCLSIKERHLFWSGRPDSNWRLPNSVSGLDSASTLPHFLGCISQPHLKYTTYSSSCQVLFKFSFCKISKNITATGRLLHGDELDKGLKPLTL